MTDIVSLLVGSEKIALFIVNQDSCKEYFLFENFEDFEIKFDEIVGRYPYPIRIYLDNQEQNFESDYLVSITSSGFDKALEAKLNKAYLEELLVGFFPVDDKTARQFEKKIFLVSIKKEPLIVSILEKIKTIKNAVFSVSSFIVELQHICNFLKKSYVTIHYNVNELNLRTYTEFDIFVFRTSLGNLRYLVYRNQVFMTQKYSPVIVNSTDENTAGTIINDIHRILKGLDPTIKDQVNLFISANNSLNIFFQDLSHQVDKLILLTTDEIAMKQKFYINPQNQQSIDQLAMITFNNNNIIANIVDREFKTITYIENLNHYLRWPILILSIFIVITFIGFHSIDAYQVKKIKSATRNKVNYQSNLNNLKRQYDVMLNESGVIDILPLYQEIVGAETPFKMIEIVSSLKSPNLEFLDIAWNSFDNEASGAGLLSQTIIIANIKTDSKNSFISVINDFLIKINKLNPNYLVDYSRPTQKFLTTQNGDDNPLIIKIRNVTNI